jgi:hypothetical protein
VPTIFPFVADRQQRAFRAVSQADSISTTHPRNQNAEKRNNEEYEVDVTQRPPDRRAARHSSCAGSLFAGPDLGWRTLGAEVGHIGKVLHGTKLRLGGVVADVDRALKTLFKSASACVSF